MSTDLRGPLRGKLGVILAVCLGVIMLGVIMPNAALAAGSPLESLLQALSRRENDEAMRAIPGVTWGQVRYPVDSEKDTSHTYFLDGKLRLSGFGEVDVPVGVGVNFTTKKANEGDARIDVRFSNSKNPAIRGSNNIIMSKFYPSADYEAILRREITQGEVTLLADNCTRDRQGRPAEDEQGAFYRIIFPGAPTAVFVHASQRVDGGKYSPGETFFEFSLFTPGTHLVKSECTLRAR